mmetsp:Transcript_56754/g.133231  ORF Transcript_56754/g.133231 Transcript_56754/m.133231 type:complete len:115 (-) Transcript_56754:998-1342(-)
MARPVKTLRELSVSAARKTEGHPALRVPIQQCFTQRALEAEGCNTRPSQARAVVSAPVGSPKPAAATTSHLTSTLPSDLAPDSQVGAALQARTGRLPHRDKDLLPPAWKGCGLG